MRDYAEVYQDIKIKMSDLYREVTDGDKEKALKIAADIKILSAELIQSLIAK
jgi:hypothetical protein